MKTIICGLLLLPLFLNGPLSAQTGACFGFKGGYSMSTQYGIDVPDIPYTVDSHFRHGMAGGLVVLFPITESFGIQQEFLYVMKGSREDITVKDLPVSTHTEYIMNYLELPFVFKYTFVTWGSFRIYGSSGFALSILLNGESTLNGVVTVGGAQIPFTESTTLKGVDIFDYGFLYGAGLDFDFLDTNCFFDYRFTIGWNTLMMPTSTGQAPAPLRNQDYVFSLGMYL